MENSINLILLISAIIFAGLFWVAFINRGSQQSLGLLKPIVGGLIVALFFFLGAFFSPLDNIKHKTHVSLLAKNSGEVVLYEKLTALYLPVHISNGYRTIYDEALAYKHRLPEDQKKSLGIRDQEYFLELVECATFSWIAQNYPMHWQVVMEWHNDISGGGGHIERQDNAYEKTAKINVVNLLRHNRFIERKKEMYIYLPLGTKHHYEKMGSLKRKIILNNTNLSIEIYFEHVGGGEIGASKLAELISGREPGDKYIHNILVTFNVEINRWHRWSKLTEQQIKWIRDLIRFYDDSFSWNVIRDKIEKSLLLEHILRIKSKSIAHSAP